MLGKILSFCAKNKDALIVGGLAVLGAGIGVAIATSDSGPDKPVVTEDAQGNVIVEAQWVETTPTEEPAAEQA
jgi:hypothetical protein